MTQMNDSFSSRITNFRLIYIDYVRDAFCCFLNEVDCSPPRKEGRQSTRHHQSTSRYEYKKDTSTR